MKIKISDLRLKIDEPKEKLQELAAKKLGIAPERILQLIIKKESVDARRREITFVYTVEIEIAEGTLDHLPQDAKLSLVQDNKPKNIQHGNETLNYPPVVVGAGPAGLFAALLLAQEGYKPLLLERGNNVDKRTEDVKKFWQEGIIDTQSNVQFGEGGAGTFSDGKLTTRIKDPRVEVVLRELISAGAPEEIAYQQKPHVGTDHLKDIVKEIRSKIISLGGQVRFLSQVTDLTLQQDQVVGIVVNDEVEIPADTVVLAIGHSARDTYSMLSEKISMEHKPFAIGVRIEHPQQLIDKVQYGAYAHHPRLGPADYHLTYRDKETGRSAYTFCMCPGGYVVAGASEPNTVVTNGMSEAARDSGIANSALVVTVDTRDFSSDHILAGLEFQRYWEQQAFQLGGANYHAPCQSVEDFLTGRVGHLSQTVKSTYNPGVTSADLNKCLPGEIAAVIKRALLDFDRKIPGFAAKEAPLTGVETRTSSPVRLLRDKETQAVNITGLYPAGEGAGYAGGIMSAAVDGVRVAENIINKYSLPKQ